MLRAIMMGAVVASVLVLSLPVCLEALLLLSKKLARAQLDRNSRPHLNVPLVKLRTAISPSILHKISCFLIETLSIFCSRTRSIRQSVRSVPNYCTKILVIGCLREWGCICGRGKQFGRKVWCLVCTHPFRDPTPFSIACTTRTRPLNNVQCCKQSAGI
ncbi:hypothetical protein K474DRAFT_1498389 [Panus rudis PR-1116 ss-1]|nr:hypothetical protein K474DRAFT_1498389 [Panus rudis PR-1116 ss-1]